MSEPLAYGAVAGMVLFHSSRAQFGLLKTDHHKLYAYGIYFLCSMMTVLIEIFFIVYNISDWIVYVYMFWGVLGPLVDVLWTRWPDGGAAVLMTSQYLFTVHTWSSDWPPILMLTILIITGLDMGVVWYLNRRSSRTAFGM
jgi:hypothetical protein